MSAVFRDRRNAGWILAGELTDYADRPEVIVLGLPRGGIPVAFEVASALRVPLDAFMVRKLGVPGIEELAMGAIASGGTMVLDRAAIHRLRIPRQQVRHVIALERRELERRERAYRGSRPPLCVDGMTVILIDDGLATGSTMLAAVKALRAHDPTKLVVAVPVAAPRTCADLEPRVGEVVCLLQPESFYAVGAWYDDFTPTSDAEVRSLLAQAEHDRQPRKREAR